MEIPVLIMLKRRYTSEKTFLSSSSEGCAFKSNNRFQCWPPRTAGNPVCSLSINTSACVSTLESSGIGVTGTCKIPAWPNVSESSSKASKYRNSFFRLKGFYQKYWFHTKAFVHSAFRRLLIYPHIHSWHRAHFSIWLSLFQWLTKNQPKRLPLPKKN